METLSFTLGMLSVIIAVFIAVLVWGVVKVVKQQKQLVNFDQDLQSVWREMGESHRDLEQRFKDIERMVDERHQSSCNTIQEIERDINQHIQSKYAESISYTDSRIDKTIDTYLGTPLRSKFKGENENKKQVLKG